MVAIRRQLLFRRRRSDGADGRGELIGVEARPCLGPVLGSELEVAIARPNRDQADDGFEVGHGLESVQLARGEKAHQVGGGFGVVIGPKEEPGLATDRDLPNWILRTVPRSVHGYLLRARWPASLFRRSVVTQPLDHARPDLAYRSSTCDQSSVVVVLGVPSRAPANHDLLVRTGERVHESSTRVWRGDESVACSRYAQDGHGDSRGCRAVVETVRPSPPTGQIPATPRVHDAGRLVLRAKPEHAAGRSPQSGRDERRASDGEARSGRPARVGGLRGYRNQAVEQPGEARDTRDEHHGQKPPGTVAHPQDASQRSACSHEGQRRRNILHRGCLEGRGRNPALAVPVSTPLEDICGKASSSNTPCELSANRMVRERAVGEDNRLLVAAGARNFVHSNTHPVRGTRKKGRTPQSRGHVDRAALAGARSWTSREIAGAAVDFARISSTRRSARTT